MKIESYSNRDIEYNCWDLVKAGIIIIPICFLVGLLGTLIFILRDLII